MSVSTAILGNKRQNRVFLVGWIAVKIHARVKLLEHAAREHRDIQVGSLKNISGSGHASRLDRLKRAVPVVRRAHASETQERGIHNFILSVVGMIVFAVCVGLPYLNHGIRNRRSIAIEHATG